jgi:hypothetical protein
MASENVERLRRGYEAWNRTDGKATRLEIYFDPEQARGKLGR